MGWLYLFTFLAGMATVLSPCVLPVLPAILSAGLGRGRYRPLGIVLGLMASFAFFTLSLTFLVHHLGISATFLRLLSIAIIALFGLVMLFPSLSDLFAQKTASVADLGSKIQGFGRGSGFGSGLILGVALGLVWTPCAGPILAAVTTLVATEQVSTKVVLLTLMYTLGTGIPLFFIALGGNRALTKFPSIAKHTEDIRKVFGVVMILTAIALYYNWETKLAVNLLPGLKIEDNAVVQKELQSLKKHSSFLEALQQGKGNVKAPEFPLGLKWINSPPLTLNDLKGKVVLVDFWTYSCINCIRTLPYITKWYETYKDKGLVIVGVHTPEFEFEKDFNNVKSATERFNITYPVVLDSDYKIWQSYSNNYWPAHYLIDQEGVVRDFHFGEGAYGETENKIRALLGMKPLEMKEEAKSRRLITPETYLGAFRGDSYVHPIKSNEVEFYVYAPPLPKDGIGLKGKWLVEGEKITSKGGSLDLNFMASHVYLVMEAPKGAAVQVLLDGKPLPKEDATPDMDGEGRILVKEPRKYDVYSGDYGRHNLSLVIPEGVSAYAFTFGE